MRVCSDSLSSSRHRCAGGARGRTFCALLNVRRAPPSRLPRQQSALTRSLDAIPSLNAGLPRGEVAIPGRPLDLPAFLRALPPLLATLPRLRVDLPRHPTPVPAREAGLPRGEPAQDERTGHLAAPVEAARARNVAGWGFLPSLALSCRAVPVAQPDSPPRRTPDDDSLDELPPLDGEDDDREAPADDLDEDEVNEAGTGDPYDDKTGEDDALAELTELEVGSAEGGWLTDAADADTLDVGAVDLIGADDASSPELAPARGRGADGKPASLLDDNDEPGVGDEDFGLGDDASAAGVDAGEEGPEADDEALREEDLPGLDADEDGEGDDTSFFDPLQAEREGASEPILPPGQTGHVSARPPWADAPWGRAAAVGSALGTVHALACATRGVLAAGRAIMLVDMEGACQTLAAKGLFGGEVTGLCFDGATILASTEDGGVFVSHDGGATFAAVNAWREQVSAHEAASGLGIALGAGELWGRTAQGKLLSSMDFGATWESADIDGFVLALGIDDRGSLVALVGGLGFAEIVRGTRGALEVTRVPGPLPEVRPGVEAQIAARGAAVSFAVRGGSAVRTLDGHAWSVVEGTAGAEAVEFIDAAGTLLVALGEGDDDGIALVRAGEEGTARVVAKADKERVEGVVVLAWDEAHGVAWLGGAFGLVAVQPAISVKD